MKRFFPWPGLVFVFIGTTVLVQGATLFYALGDDSFAAVADYDAKAQAWDEHSADLRASEALGWDITATGTTVEASAMILELQLEGAPGPVQGRFVAYHNGHPQQRYEGAVQGDDAGRLAIPIGDDRPGWWQLELELSRGTDHFEQRQKLWLPVGSAPPPRQDAP